MTDTVTVPFMPTVNLSPDALVTVATGETLLWAECQRRILAASPEGDGGGWRDISTAPLDDRKVIVTDGLGVYGGAWFHPREAAWLDCDGCVPTHWRPLPSPPVPSVSGVE